MTWKVTHDAAVDVLYVKEEGTSIVNSNELPEDGYFIQNFNAQGKLVGLQILEATTTPYWWWAIVARSYFPQELREAVDPWFVEHIGVKTPSS